MSAQDSSDYELLTEHFGYPPVTLLDDIINTVNVLADRALDSVERLLLTIPPQKLGFGARRARGNGTKDGGDDDEAAAAEAARREIENGTHQLETLLNASIDKNFDLFELYTMRNILTVRPRDRAYMRLAHYDGLDLLAPARTDRQQHPDRPTVESVTALRRRLQASQRLHAALEAERLRNDALLRQLRASLGIKEAGVKQEADASPSASPSPFAFLGDKGTLTESGGEQPITTTTEFTLSQLQALRSLSVSLRTLLPDVGPAEPAPSDASAAAADEEPAGPSWRRERTAYVEASSRKYLERVGGLELGPLGDVRDGEWQGAGRRLSRGEVEGLEGAAAALRAAAEAGGPRGRRARSEPAGGTVARDEAEAMDES